MKLLSNHQNYGTPGITNPRAEDFTGRVSQTDPSQHISLQSMLERYTRTGQISSFTGVYDEAGDVPAGIEYMDTLERLDMARSIRAAADDFREQKIAEKEAKKAAAAEAAAAKKAAEKAATNETPPVAPSANSLGDR